MFWEAVPASLVGVISGGSSTEVAMFWEEVIANFVGGASVAGIFLLISLVMARVRAGKIRMSLNRSIQIALRDIAIIADSCVSDPLIAQALHGPYSTLHGAISLHDINSGLSGLEGYLARLQAAIAGLQSASAILFAETTGTAKSLHHDEKYIPGLKANVEEKANALRAETDKLKGLLKDER